MINKYSIAKIAIGVAGASTLLLGFAFSASAATTPATGTSASLTLAQVIARSDTTIDKRIQALTTMATRMSAMKNVQSSTETTLASQTQAKIASLTTLKAKIDADTDLATARADAKAIVSTGKVAVSETRQVSQSARVSDVVASIAKIQTKLETRITADQSAGKDVSALQTAYADMTAKIADATAQATTAQNGAVSLKSAAGQSAIKASNKAIVTADSAAIKTATADLKAARADITTIMNGLKSLE